MNYLPRTDEEQHAAITAVQWRKPIAAPASEDPAIVHLRQELAAAQRQYAQSQDEHRGALEAAALAAREEILTQMARDDTRAHEALKACLTGAETALRSTLAEMEVGAHDLALAALELVFGDQASQQALVHAAISTQLKELDRDLVIELSVSAEDFQDEKPLKALVAQHPATRVCLSNALGAGQALIVLRLGAIELSLTDFRTQLRARLMGADTP